MELFKAEKVGEMESKPQKRCRVCGKTLQLLNVVYFPDRASTVRSFECECGERVWDE